MRARSSFRLFSGLLVACLCSTCGSSEQTALLLTVELPAQAGIDQLVVRLRSGEEASLEQRTAASSAPLESGTTVLAKVPERWDGLEVIVEVEGLKAGTSVASGLARAKVIRYVVVGVTVTLAAGCQAECMTGESQCSDDKVQSCAVDALGCGHWGLATACPKEQPYCSNGACSETCSDECSAGGKRCTTAGQAVQLCGQHDSDTCQDWGPAVGCRAEELCSNGQCVLSCEGKPCPSCTAGQTQTCKDVGECKGGVRGCENGTFGACTWQVKPTAEICDGKDNDCNGQVDDKCSGDTCTPSDPVIVDPTGASYHLSLKLDSAGKVHISYGAPHANTDLKYATNASGAWKTTTIDSAGEIGPTSSLALDAAGKVHISYHDVTNLHLKYATNASGSWKTTTIDSAEDVGARSSLALDSTGKVYISYLDGKNLDVKLATNASGSWQIATVDSQGDMGLDNTSLALDGAGKAWICYYDATNKHLKVATNASGTWQASAIDGQGDIGAGQGAECSLAIDAAGKIWISYYDFTNKDLKLATNAAGTWMSSTVDSQGDVGWVSSLALDRAGKAWISYYDSTNKDLKLATNAAGSWKVSLVDSQDDAGIPSSLAVDSTGKIHMAYDRDISETSCEMRYVTRCP